MTPKEQAIYLIEECKDENFFSLKEILENSKYYAKIIVKQILKNQPYDIYTIEQCNNIRNYWDEVNQEIEKYDS